MGEEGAGDDVDAFAGDQLLGGPYRIAGIGAVVARHHLELLAEHAALGVDLLDRELPALLVGIKEGRLRLIAVELADLDRALRESGRAEEAKCGGRRGEAKQMRSRDHAVLQSTDAVPQYSPAIICVASCASLSECHFLSRARSISDFSWPPSISIMVPFTMCISGEASMTTRLATSSTSAMRPMGMEAGASLSASS